MTSTLIDRLHGVSEGVAVKRPCRAATTANISLSGLQSIDGVALAENDRVLVRSQADPTRNGIYSASTGNWSRSADFDGSRDVVKGTRVFITDGTTNANKQFIVTSSDLVAIGDSAISFAEITENVIDDDARIPQTPVIAINDDYASSEADRGSVINADCTGDDIALTLPSAATAGNGFRITVRHVGTGNTVTIVASSGEAIDGKASFALTARYEGVCLVCDGSNWHIDGHARPFMTGGVPFLFIISRALTSPPVSPVPGARYILGGTGSGDWSAYTAADVLEANGQGGWIRYTPAAGWHGYDANAGEDVFYNGSGWQALPNTNAPASSVLPSATFREQHSNGTDGGSNVAGQWTPRPLNTTVSNTIAGASLSAATITLPAGDYFIVGTAHFRQVDNVRLRFKSTSTSKQLLGLNTRFASSNDSSAAPVTVLGPLTLSAQESFTLDYWASTQRVTDGLGSANGDAEVEVYATVDVISLTALQGPAGAQGAQGAHGFAGFEFDFSTATTIADPGAGFVRLNNANLTLVTAVAIDRLSSATGAPDISDEVAAWNDTGILKIVKIGAEENWATYNVTAVADNTDWLQATLSYRDHAGSLSNNDNIALQFIPKGATGLTGATGSTGATGATGATGPNVGLDYRWSTATSGDPGSGKLLGTNASISLITQINISESNRQSASQAAHIATWDDSTTTGARGVLRILDVAAPGTNWMEFQITGAMTDAGGYDTFPVSYISHAGTIAHDTIVSVAFFRTGNQGAGDLTAANNLSDLASPKTGYDNISVHGGNAVSAGTIDLDAAFGNLVDITGAAAITAITLANGRERTVRFTGALTLTHGASLVLPGAANIVTANGDFAVFRGYSGGLVRCAQYLRAAGRPLNSGVADTIGAVGFSATPFDFGTKSTGAFTPDPASGNFQSGINGGAHTLAPPSNSCTMILQYTNNGSAGAITTSGFSKKTGDAITTTNGDDFLFFITKVGSFSHLHVQALQ